MHLDVVGPTIPCERPSLEAINSAAQRIPGVPQREGALSLGVLEAAVVVAVCWKVFLAGQEHPLCAGTWHYQTTARLIQLAAADCQPDTEDRTCCKNNLQGKCAGVQPACFWGHKARLRKIGIVSPSHIPLGTHWYLRLRGAAFHR